MRKEEKERLRENKGITLVALVVTIVILLILAGISITLILDNNGIINKSGEAADKYGEAQANEQEQLSTAEDDIDKILGTYDPLKKVPEKTLDEARSNDMLNGTEITKIKFGDETVVIPAGYKVAEDSADTVDFGIVITDAESDGNEWVWIPVDETTLSGMYETAEEPIAITGGSSLSVISGVSASKYSKSGIISGSYGTRVLPNDTSSYREPDVVVGSGGSQYDAVESNRTTAGFIKEDGSTMTLAEMAQTMVDEYSDMLDSIKTYGGFYIGRYELSEAGVKENQPVLTEVNWYILYAKSKSLAKEGSNVTTRMIWGCQWDVTCNWIASNGEQKSITDSSTWGNYKTTDVYSSDGSKIIKASGTSTKLNTGVTTFTKANNIYDLAGNCSEWTQEAYNTNNRCNRGGYFGQPWR